MAFRGMAEFIQTLEEAGELVRIPEYVDPKLEITDITDRVSKNGGPALLFENTGADFPLLINAMGSYRRMCLALGVEHMDDITQEIEEMFKQMTAPKNSMAEKLKMLPTLSKVAKWMPKVRSGRGECQQVVYRDPDLNQLPIMQCWPHDGGPYITLPVIHTKDPNTGSRNVGMYRIQQFTENTVAMHWQLHKVSRRHFEEYRKLGKKMPVAIVLGGDPVYTYAATAPLPDGIDEYILAGFLRKRRVDLVPCVTQPDMEVPSDADIVIEGYVDPNEELVYEGPFGDHTGFYSLDGQHEKRYPKLHVTAITHRKAAVYPSTIVGIPPQEDAWIGKATERIFLAPMKMTMVHEILDMDLPIEGVFHNMAIVKIQKDFPGQALKVMNSIWGAGQMAFTKMQVLVDQNAQLNSYKELAQLVSKNFDPEHDLVISKGPIDVLDHSCSTMAFGGKLGIDATSKLPEEAEGRPSYPAPEGANIDVAALQAEFPELKAINTELLQAGISLVFVAIEKQRKGHVKQIARQLLAREAFAPVKVVIFMDPEVDLTQVQDTVWTFSNNTDVKRDSVVIEADEGNGYAHLALDGTRKTKALDDFPHVWPNILVMDDDTIASVDEKWPRLGLGEFLPSPSRKYKRQLYGDGPIAQAASEPVASEDHR